MDISQYLNMIKIKNLHIVNPSLKDIIQELSQDFTIDAISYKLRHDFPPDCDFSKLYRLNTKYGCYDIITNFTSNLPIRIKVDDNHLEIHDKHILLNQDTSVHFEVDSKDSSECYIEFTAYTFSKVVKHEFVYYRRNNLLS